MATKGRIAAIAAIALFSALTTSFAQDSDPYELLTPSYYPFPANYANEITLRLDGPLTNSCFGHSVWGIPHGDTSPWVIDIPVLVSFCDMCVTPSPPFELEIPIGQIPPGEYPIAFRIIEEIRCRGGVFDSVSFDTAFVYDTLHVGTVGCLTRGDIDGNGVIDIADVIAVIGVAFRNEPSADNPCDPSPEDLNCDGYVDVNDVVLIVNTAFRNGPEPNC